MENAANEKQEQAELIPVADPATEAGTTAPSEVGMQPGETGGDAVGESGGVDIGSQAAEPAPRLPRTIRGKIESDGTAVSTGRRKTAVARVRLRKGSGKVTINGRAFEDYFPVERHRLMIEAPLKATGVFGQVDIWVRANGGGVNGQAGAVILGVARAIQALHPEQHGALSDGGYLTRDDRMVERKKYGHRKARRSFQFSKR
jgi:small subunit ribosomal protein S9